MNTNTLPVFLYPRGIAFNLPLVSSSWISVFFGIISFVMFLPKFFVEYDVMSEERDYNAAKKQAEADDAGEVVQDLPKPDYLTAFVCIVAFFFYLFNFIIVET